MKFQENDIITPRLALIAITPEACSPKDRPTVSSARLPTPMCLWSGRQSTGNRMYLNCC